MTEPGLKSVPEVLEGFDGTFNEVANAFVRGEYLLWLGSGISRGRVPDVVALLQDLLAFLQSNIVRTDPNCRFRRALEEVLDFAQLPDDEREKIDVLSPVEDWPNLTQIARNLRNQYADVLDVPVDGEPADFLVWNGLRVPTTYGAPTIEPDVEHLCVAILMNEGVVVSAPTTNWDALVEAAVDRLSEGDHQILNVIVKAADFGAPRRRAELVKFHGCAKHAAENEADYRRLLVARRSQIAGWTTEPANRMMKNHLEHLLASRPAIIVGLSAQDANIHTVLFQAAQNLEHPWPTSPPAVVLAEPTVHQHHRLVLQATYGQDVYAANADDIRESAVLGAYARPVLIALVLFTLTDKLCTMVASVPELGIAPGDEERIRSDLRLLRDKLGASAVGDPLGFMTDLISSVTTALTIFRSGQVPVSTSQAYEPICISPVHDTLANPDFDAPAFGRFAVAISLLARGHIEGEWRLRRGQRDQPGAAAAYVDRGGRMSKVLLVRGHKAFADLEKAGVLDGDDETTLVIQAERIADSAARSPHAVYGRSGRSGIRRLDLEELCGAEDSADALFRTFLLEGAL